MATRARKTPKAPIVRFKFHDGTEFDVDLLKVLMETNRQKTFVIAEMNRQRAKGRNTAHKNVLNANYARDCEIVGDEILFRLFISRRDRGDCSDLHALLAEHKVPKPKWATFKPENVTAALAKKHGLSKPAIRSIVKNWEVRYQTS